MDSAIDVLKDWVWYVFLNGFCVSLTRPGILIFLLLVLFLRFGAGLGLPLLFWRPRDMPPTHPPEPSWWKRALRWVRKKLFGAAGPAAGAPVQPVSGRTRPHLVAQLFVGVGVGVLVWQVLLAGYLFEEFATNYTKDRPPFCENREKPWLPAPAFGGNDRGYPDRFRYDPQQVRSVWLYGAAVGTGFVAFVLGAGALAGAVDGGLGAYRRLRYPRWKPFSPAAPRERPPWWKRVVNRAVQLLTGIEPYRDPSDRTPIPYSPALPVGVLTGLLAMSWLTSVWFAGPLEIGPLGVKLDPARYGAWAVRQGGYGAAADRQEQVKYRVLAQEREKEVDPFSQVILAAVGKTATGVSDAVNPDTTIREDTTRWKPEAWLAPYYPVYGAFFLNFVIIAVFSVALMALPLRFRIFSPAVGIVFFLNLFLYLQVLFNYFFALPVDYVALVGVALVLLAGRGYKFKFSHLGDYYTAPVELPKLYADRAAEDANHTKPNSAPPPAPGAIKPLDSRKVPYPNPKVASGKRPLALVCVSGGGSRAAAWSMKALLEIERAFGNPVEYHKEADRPLPPEAKPVAFPYHVRLVTGASGGMIAAAQYVASLAAPDAAQPPADPDNLSGVKRNGSGARARPNVPGAFPGTPLTRAQLFDGVCDDFLTPIVHSLVTRDLLSLLLPFHLTGTDRGKTVEEEWKVVLKGQLDQTFGDLRAGEEAGWRPSLIFSPMLVEDGRQLLISNLDLYEVVQNRALLLGETPVTNGSHCSGVKGDLNPPDGAGRRLLSREGLEFFKVFPQAHDFRVSTAARMSASFPYVMPAVPLPTNPPRRVVDAGYADNYGVGVAASWLFNHMDWVKEHCSGVVVIQIRDGASGSSRRRECVFDAFPSVTAAGLQWATSPPEGLWNYRTASHAFRDDNLLHLLAGSFEQRHTNGQPWFDPEFFTTVSFELQQGNEVALNFTLTEGERQIILDAVNDTGFRDQVAALLAWWYSR